MKEYICLKYNNNSLKFYCFPEKVLVGLTSENVENTELNKESVEKIFKNAIDFRKEYEGTEVK